MGFYDVALNSYKRYREFNQEKVVSDASKTVSLIVVSNLLLTVGGARMSNGGPSSLQICATLGI